MPGLLDFYNDPSNQALLGLAGGLLAASGPSPHPVSVGSALGQGLLSSANMFNRASAVQAENAVRNAQVRAAGLEEQAAPYRLDILRSQANTAMNPPPILKDLGGVFGIFDPRTFTQIGVLPKSATPDAVLKEGGAMQRHLMPSGSVVLQEQGAQERHVTPSGGAVLSAQTTMRGQNMTDARSRELNAITREGQQTQIINDPIQGPILVNKATGAARPAIGPTGAPIVGETVAKGLTNAADVEALLNDAQKNISGSTGGYVGAGIDQLARVFSLATPGAIKIGNLKAIEGALLSKMPRMEGPQSNYDVQAYRQAVGDIGNATVPNEQKAAALATVKAIQERYALGPQGTPWNGFERRAGPQAPQGFKVLGVERP